MSNYRLDKLNSLIKEEVGKIIIKEIEFPPGVFASINKVKTSADLSFADVTMSVIPSKRTGSVTKILRKRTPLIHTKLRKRLFIKSVPSLRWQGDHSQDKAERINVLLKNIQDHEDPEA